MDKLIRQVESLLHKQNALEKENEKLKKNEEKNISLISSYEKSLQDLNDRLEKLLTL